MGSIVVKHYRFRWAHGTFKLLINEQVSLIWGHLIIEVSLLRSLS